MGLMIILIGVEMTSSTSIHLALDIIKSWEAKNTGDYVKSSVINHAILPGINVIGQHVQTIEKEQEMLRTGRSVWCCYWHWNNHHVDQENSSRQPNCRC